MGPGKEQKKTACPARPRPCSQGRKKTRPTFRTNASRPDNLCPGNTFFAMAMRRKKARTDWYYWGVQRDSCPETRTVFFETRQENVRRRGSRRETTPGKLQPVRRALSYGKGSAYASPVIGRIWQRGSIVHRSCTFLQLSSKNHKHLLPRPHKQRGEAAKKRQAGQHTGTDVRRNHSTGPPLFPERCRHPRFPDGRRRPARGRRRRIPP